MSRANLLADIRKLRSNSSAASEPAQKVNTSKNMPPPAPLTSGALDRADPKTGSPTSFDMTQRDTDSTTSRVRRKKKKKRGKKGNDGMGGNDSKLDNFNNYASLTQKNDIESRSRINTRISVLEDGIPQAQDLLNFGNYSPNLQWTFAFGFLASIDIMINIPTLYDAVEQLNSYSGDSTYFYVYIFSVYVAMQMIGSVLLGVWIDRRPIVEILAFSAFSMTLGNLLYTHGVAKHAPGLLLVARGLCGLAGSILVVGYAHVTRYTKRSKRESRIQAFRFVTASGTIFGPLLGVIVSGGTFNILFWEISATNAGAFIVMCLSFIYFVCLVTWMFVSCRRSVQRDIGVSRMLEQSESREDYDLNDSPAGAGAFDSLEQGLDSTALGAQLQRRTLYWSPHRLCSGQAFLLWLLYFSGVFAFWSFEAAILPVGQVKGKDTWSTRTLYSMFVLIGVIYLISFLLNRYIANYFGIRKEKRVIASLLVMVVGALFLTDLGLDDGNNDNTPPTWQVILATPFLTFGFCVATLQLPAMYCKLVGATMGDLGIRMSWFFALASIGMLAGPVYGFIVIDTCGSVNFVAHTSAFVLLLASLVGFAAMKTELDGEKGNKTQVGSSANLSEQVGTPHVGADRNDLHTGLLTDRL